MNLQIQFKTTALYFLGLKKHTYMHVILKNLILGFPGGSVVKNSPANAGDLGSIPYRGRSHKLQNIKAPVLQLLSLCSRACSLQQEKPLQWEACAPQLENSPCFLQLEKACMQKRRSRAAIRSDQISRSVMSDSSSPMNRSMPGLPDHHQLPEFTQTHVHRVSDAIQPSHPLLSPSPLAPNPSQHQSLFQWVNSSHEVVKVLEFQL